MAEDEVEGSPYKIQTFVFLDLETLGLYDKPRILEISMIAVSREDLLSMKCQAHKNNIHYNKGDPFPLPRVCLKYTMLYYPKRIVYPLIEKITGLSNYNLNHLKAFDKDSADGIKLFLDLPPPVGIVAHNGDRFDFPILKAELMGVYEESLEGVVCIDSLLFSRQFEKEDIKKIVEIASDFLNDDDDEFDTPNNAQVVENETNDYVPLPERIQNTPSCSSELSTSNIPYQGFQTPQKVKTDDIPTTPPYRPSKNGLPPLVKFTPSSKRPLLENTSLQNGSTPSKAKKALFQQNIPENYPERRKKPCSLPHIYYRIFGQDYPAHRAESDAEALLQICAFHGQDFVSWADSNFTPFRKVKPRWCTKRQFVIE